MPKPTPSTLLRNKWMAPYVDVVVIGGGDFAHGRDRQFNNVNPENKTKQDPVQVIEYFSLKNFKF